MLAMNVDFNLLKTPDDICKEIAANMRARRKAAKLSQMQMSKKAGVSLGSLKRFEQSGEISLVSLVKLATVLDLGNEFASLFAKQQYASIQEIIDEQI